MSGTGSGFGFVDKADVTVERGGRLAGLSAAGEVANSPGSGGIKFKGRFIVEHLDKHGVRKGRYEFDNTVTNQGKNDNLGVYFNSVTQTTTWYAGLVDNSGFSAFAVGDTAASHAGWVEFSGYSESVRQTWTPTIATQQAQNASPMVFTISGSGTIKGLFVGSSNTKGGSGGILWGAAAFGSTVPVSIGDLLRVTYTVQAT